MQEKLSAVNHPNEYGDLDLLQAQFDAPTIVEETAALNCAGIVSLDVMKQLTDSDWRGIGLKVGSSRVLQVYSSNPFLRCF